MTSFGSWIWMDGYVLWMKRQLHFYLSFFVVSGLLTKTGKNTMKIIVN
jgi:hypothetical protein